MAYRKLGRTSSQRKAMLRDLTTDLIINEAIVTSPHNAYKKDLPESTLPVRHLMKNRPWMVCFVRQHFLSGMSEFV